MAINPHPGRILQALDRVQDLLDAEFDDLTPPDRIFVLDQLSYTHHEMFSMRVKEGR